MADQRLDVYLLAEPQAGTERATLVRNLAAVFKKDVPVIEKMLRKPRSLLKADVDPATAAKYKAAIQKAGGHCEIIDHGEEPFPVAALTPVTPRSALTVAPVEVTEVMAVSRAAAENLVITPTPVGSPYAAPATNSDVTSHFCYKCGKSIAPLMTQCPYCLAPQRQMKSKDKMTAGLLAFFIGGLGVHRFYLGQWWGIFYLIFWFSFIPSVVSVIEAIVFWATSDERWKQKYGQVPASGASTAVILAVAGFFFIAVIGILAAVALPAYQDYTTRSKIQASMPLVEKTQQQVAAVIQEKDFYPSENILAGLPEKISDNNIRSILLGDNAQLVVTYNFSHLKADANNIIWVPKRTGDTISWTCTSGNLPDKVRPPECRTGSNSLAMKQTGSNSANMRTYSDDKTISIVTPASWKGDRSLNAEASIGIANMRDNLYSVLLRESKVDFDATLPLQAYTDLITSGLKDSAKDYYVAEPLQNLTIGGLEAQQQSLAATVDGIKIIYVITTINSEKEFFVIYSWTLASRFEANKALLKKVNESFQLH